MVVVRSGVCAIFFASESPAEEFVPAGPSASRTCIVLVRSRAGNDPVGAEKRRYFGEGAFPLDGVESVLRQLASPLTTPDTLLVAELFGEPSEADPLGARLGHGRLLRVSSLIPAPDAC